MIDGASGAYFLGRKCADADRPRRDRVGVSRRAAVAEEPQEHTMRILYVINGFDPGGAEHGLLTLVDSGFFAGHDLKILALCQGRGHLASRMMPRPPAPRTSCWSPRGRR